MKRLYIPLILFIILIFEGVAIQFLPYRIVSGDLLFIPHWILLFLVLLAIFYDQSNTYHSVLYALVFGLLMDIIYTGILGGYMFSYTLSIYIVHGLKKLLHGNFFVTMLLGLVSLIISDISIYVIYTVIGFTDMLWTDYLFQRLFPTLGINIVLLIILYPLFVKRIINWSNDIEW